MTELDGTERWIGAKRDRSTALPTHSGGITSSEALSESRQKKKAGILEESNLRSKCRKLLSKKTWIRNRVFRMLSKRIRLLSDCIDCSNRIWLLGEDFRMHTDGTDCRKKSDCCAKFSACSVHRINCLQTVLTVANKSDCCSTFSLCPACKNCLLTDNVYCSK